MKNASLFSIALLILSALFMSQTAHAQLDQSSVTKSITTNAEFNSRSNAVFGIGATAGFKAKLDVQGAIGNTVASFRKSATGKGISIVSDWPGVYFNSYFNGSGKSMAPGYAGIVNFDPDNGRFDLGITSTAATTANAPVDVTARMVITKDGNVGIGNNAPESKLDILGQDAIRASGYEPFITLLDNNSYHSARIQAAHGDINFFKGIPDFNTGTYEYVPQLVVKNNGNVGIGHASPESKLDIAGQDGMRIFGYQPFMTLLDNSTYHSNRIQSAGGDLVFWKGVANWNTGGYDYDAPFIVKNSGNVLIGTPDDHGYKLAVNGNIICTELKVQLKSAWPDYVFADNYKLKTLEEVEAHINAEKHLPGIPAAAELEKDGLEIGDMQKKMMEKIEELTLYLIEQNKRLGQLEVENESLRARLDKSESNQK